MKTLLTTLILLILLGLGCKKPVERVTPVVTTPPGSTTTSPSATTTSPPSSTTTTPTPSNVPSYTYTIPEDMSTVVYANVPQPPANCRLVRTVYKTGSYGGNENDVEQIVINDKNHKVSAAIISMYRYDQNGRIIDEIRKHWRNYNDTISYQYGQGRIVIKSSVVEGADRYRSIDTLKLNKQGLSENRRETYKQAYFDSDGFLIRGEIAQNGEFERIITQTVTNGNIQAYSDYLRGSFGTLTKTYPNYAARANLPNLTPFYGRTSRDLPTEEIISNKGSIYYSDGLKYRTRYLYQFDQSGRVKRRIAYSVVLNTDWPYAADVNGIGVMDYEYECP